jgi:hypothetical protein
VVSRLQFDYSDVTLRVVISIKAPGPSGTQFQVARNEHESWNEAVLVLLTDTFTLFLLKLKERESSEGYRKSRIKKKMLGGSETLYFWGRGGERASYS